MQNKLDGLFFFFNRTTLSATEGKLRQQVSGGKKKTQFGFFGCSVWVDPAQTFPACTLVGVAPAFLSHTVDWKSKSLFFSYSHK